MAMLKKTKSGASGAGGSIGDQIKSSAAAKGLSRLKKLAKLDENMIEERLFICLFNDVLVHQKVWQLSSQSRHVTTQSSDYRRLLLLACE
jgi:hypothetical protein